MTHRLQTNHLYQQQHAHQRQMMAMLGIDVWALREQPAQPTTLSIFRDQSDESEFIVAQEQQVELTAVTAQSLLQADAKSQARPNVDSTTLANTQHQAQSADSNLINQNHAPLSLDKTNNTQQVVVEQNADVTKLSTSQAELEPPLELAAFELHACIFEHVAIIVEVQQLSANEGQLWANIRACQNAQLRALTWPSPVSNFQDGHGVAAYVAGFIDALGNDLTIICLGECNHLSAIPKQQLPSLGEMIQQPLLKRALWQAIRQA